MSVFDRATHYGSVSILNHWIVAVLIVIMLALGLIMGEFPKGELHSTLVQIHKSIGVFLLLYGAWRVLWRLVFRFPDEASAMAAWQAWIAKAVHWFLLLAIVVMPLSGYIGSSSGGHPVTFFGLFALPALPENEALNGAAFELHEILAYILIGVIALHALAALKHHLIDKDDTLRRMIGR
ncbi:MAG: cytochrome b [Rhodospirillales bacterium]